MKYQMLSFVSPLSGCYGLLLKCVLLMSELVFTNGEINFQKITEFSILLDVQAFCGFDQV